MRIAFNPALGTTTRVAVPSLDGEAHMRLLAVLDEKEYAELKKAGAIVQAWSDMPGGGGAQGSGASWILSRSMRRVLRVTMRVR